MTTVKDGGFSIGNKKTTKTAILKGYGDFYGHNFKAKITEEKEDWITIISNGIKIEFDSFNGFEYQTERQRNGYQLDINSISEGKMSENITIYRVNEFGQISV